jgi:hypothetical protein
VIYSQIAQNKAFIEILLEAGYTWRGGKVFFRSKPDAYLTFNDIYNPDWQSPANSVGNSVGNSSKT